MGGYCSVVEFHWEGSATQGLPVYFCTTYFGFFLKNTQVKGNTVFFNELPDRGTPCLGIWLHKVEMLKISIFLPWMYEAYSTNYSKPNTKMAIHYT